MAPGWSAADKSTMQDDGRCAVAVVRLAGVIVVFDAVHDDTVCHNGEQAGMIYSRAKYGRISSVVASGTNTIGAILRASVHRRESRSGVRDHPQVFSTHRDSGDRHRRR